MIIKEKFQGIFPALLTPFDKDDKINREQLVKLIDMNLAKGVKGFYVDGSTAEAFMMSQDERKEVLKICAETCLGKCTLIAHVGAINTKHAVELAKYAESLGYDAVSAVAPFYYKFSFAEIKKYYFDIAYATSLPMLIYNIPAFSGVSLTLDNFREFLEDDKFMGVKYTSGDMFMLEQLRAMFPDKLIFNGYDEIIECGLAAGCDGGIGSTYNFMAEKFVQLYDLWKKGDVKGVQKIQRTCNVIIAALIKVGVMQGEKECLNQMGFDFGVTRAPFAEITEEQKKFIKETIMPLL